MLRQKYLQQSSLLRERFKSN